MVQSYADAMGISYEEAKRRLQLQNEFSLLEQKVIEGEPSYAGSWTMHQPEFGLMVAFASPSGETLIQKYLEGIQWADLVHVQQSRYTVAELQEIAQKVMQAARETGIPFGGGSNPKTSKVTIYTPQPDEMRQQLESNLSIQEYWDDIEYIYEANMAVPAKPAEQLNSIVLSYAKDMSIPYEEAERRLKLQNEMSTLEAKIIFCKNPFSWIQDMYMTKHNLRIAIHVAIFTFALLLTNGCVLTSYIPTPTPIPQPESPLIPGNTTALLENRWRIVEITYHNTSIAFDEIQPIYLNFTADGMLSKSTTNCNVGSYYIMAENERRYHLIPGAGTAMGCGPIGDQQYADVSEAIVATTEFELRGEQLILRGDDVKIVLAADNSQ